MALWELSIPSVPAGLTIADSAKIAGDLEYTRAFNLKVPSGVVGGKVTRAGPAADPEAAVKVQPTNAQRVGTWALDMLRGMVTLLPIGLLGWLANFATILCGLGALWLWGRERFSIPVVSNQ